MWVGAVLLLRFHKGHPLRVLSSRKPGAVHFLDQMQVLERVKDHVVPLAASREAGKYIAIAVDHDPVDMTAHPDISMAIGDRHAMVVGPEAHHCLRADSALV